MLIPWLVQLWYLSQSGYAGTVGEASPSDLLTWFLPTLLAGDDLSSPWTMIVSLGWIVLVMFGLTIHSSRRERSLLWLASWVLAPTGLLLLAAFRLDVFHPRYLIAVTPALLLLTARAAVPSENPRAPSQRGVQALIQAGLLIVPLIGLVNLAHYYRAAEPKSPGWPALVSYLDDRVQAKSLIVQTLADPAFAYYYDGQADEGSLRAEVGLDAQLNKEILFYNTIWLVGRSGEVERYLAERMQLLSQDSFEDFTVTQYAQWDVVPGEIEVPLEFSFGDIVRLRGYTLQGPDAATDAITLLLYWEPLRQAAVDYTVFVHLIGPPHSATGSPLWDQDDHRPRDGFASTLTWEPGALIRDAYHLLSDPGETLPPGEFTLQVGFYDPANPNTRLPATGPDGTVLGDSVSLATLHRP
jgi:hypothetical protein